MKTDPRGVAGSALNAEQRRAVEHGKGPLLVFAGAGSGKTRVITARIAHLIGNRNVAAERILAVTFTNKAAREMKDRAARLTGPRGQSTTICTFHALGVRILRAHAEQLGLTSAFSIYDREDQLALLTEEGEAAADLRLAIATLKNQGILPAQARAAANDERAERVAMTYTRYQNRLRARNAVDLDDLLLLPHELLQREDDVARALRERFDHLLVDEYQDTNPVQDQIVRALAARTRNLCVVGDDDQAIYGWRGADLRNILHFREAWPDAAVVKLERNYRSTALILAAANALIARNQERAPKVLRAEIVGGEMLGFLLAPTPVDEAERVISRLQRRREGGADWRSMALLYRANYLSRAFEEVLRSRAIPYHLVGGHSFFERREVRDLLAYLRFLQNPDDRGSFERIIRVPRRGIGPTVIASMDAFCRTQGIGWAETMARIPEIPGLRNPARTRLDEFQRFFIHHREALRAGAGLPRVLRDMIAQLGYLRLLAAATKNEEEAAGRAENVEELVRSLAEYEAQAKQPTLAGYLDRIALLTETDKDSDDQSGITLMTLHAAKGLEFAHVVLVGFEEGVLPSPRALAEDPGAECEERRLVYVGCTRARESLLFSASCSRSRAGRQISTELSRFLDEIPARLFDIAPRTIEARFRRRVVTPGSQAGQSSRARRTTSAPHRHVARRSTPERRRPRNSQ